MGNFIEATSVASDGNVYRAEIDPEWFIWGPFGGYLAALAMRAMAAHSAFRRPATLSCQYLSVGAAGSAVIEVETLRRGRSAECLRAVLRQGERRLIEAQSWIVADGLAGLEHDDAHSPSAEPPSSLPDWRNVGEEEQSPMWRHIQRKALKDFARPPQSNGEPRWAGWIRLIEAIPEDEFALVAARTALWIDFAPWNAAIHAHGWPTQYLAPTLDLTIQFQPDLYLPRPGSSAWMLVETASPQARAGLFGAHTRLWSEPGQLVAIGAAQALCVANSRYQGRTV